MDQKKKHRTQKSYLTIGVITLAAVIVLAGISYRKAANREDEEQEAVIMAEAEWTERTEDEEDVAETETEDADGSEEEPGTADETGGEAADADDEAKTPEMTDSTQGIVDTAENGAGSLSFSESDKLSWPLQGDVILNYSMDQSVYFATLDQYKYNPALIIAGEVNAQVTAAAAGEVLSVMTSEETGETVVMDIGDGYQLVYGQLKEVQAEVGDYVAMGDLVGFVSEPTMYYSVEGSNLYFQMLKDGEPVNPLNYLE
ncbi:MAG: peptidoglycan DD-metalloendopeptidase family protein [Clostridiales bacterium]|nr:peptidoglycan DD-metalloendopeptidase family protein [Clostridiales bacterium]